MTKIRIWGAILLMANLPSLEFQNITGARMDIETVENNIEHKYVVLLGEDEIQNAKRILSTSVPVKGNDEPRLFENTWRFLVRATNEDFIIWLGLEKQADHNIYIEVNDIRGKSLGLYRIDNNKNHEISQLLWKIHNDRKRYR